MDNLTIQFFFDRRKIATKTTKGLLQIEVRVTGTSQRKYISTGVHLYSNQFSDVMGFKCINHDNAIAITAKAHRVYRQIEAFCLSEKCRSLDDVKNWNSDDSRTTSIVDFIRAELIRKNPSYDVIEYHNSFIRRLEEFGRFVVFADLSYERLLEFDAYLRKSIQSSPTLYKRHSLFKGYINEAMKRGLCKSNPYDFFKMQKGKSKDPVFLTSEEVERIKSLKADIDKIDKARDLFIFQCYTGMAYIDMQNFARSDIQTVEGREVIRSNREKTDESFVLLFLPEAKAVAEKYDYDFPKISNQKYNDFLKLVAASAGVTKNLTSHVARHTFATYLINKGIPIESVSRALGHATIRQTQHYARMLGKKVIDDMSRLL